MTKVKGKQYNELLNLLGKRANFKSDCEFFPNFDVYGKIIGIHRAPNLEIIFKVLTNSGKTMEIGSNMKNLRYKLI